MNYYLQLCRCEIVEAFYPRFKKQLQIGRRLGRTCIVGICNLYCSTNNYVFVDGACWCVVSLSLKSKKIKTFTFLNGINTHMPVNGHPSRWKRVIHFSFHSPRQYNTSGLSPSNLSFSDRRMNGNERTGLGGKFISWGLITADNRSNL